MASEIAYEDYDGLKIRALVYDLYLEIEDELLQNIAGYFKTSNYEIGSVDWELEKLSERGALTQKNIKTIAKYSGRTEAAIRSELQNAGYSVINKNAAWLNESKNDVNYQRVNALTNNQIRAANSFILNVNRQVIGGSAVQYQNVINRTKLEVTSGIKEPQTALRTALKELGAQGITATRTTTATGQVRRESLDVTIRREMRSYTNEVVVQTQLSTASDWDIDLVEVSAHNGARPGCAPYQGQIYSISGNHPDYPA